ncbi:ATP-dependent DNA helicase Q-like 3 [Ceratocystis fimbriata CBS 114723]|uniref:ATP-dependent DNA helicase n=1 Tax=Ceratocystis fimbriata CBS 114723 TaxID=1035309 RepID=A0A2C5WYN3_9PEZI|nr:ATP-dependent DNA helicase Q-like 3 [Ceratocystis fimbriata CBS 114723]
MPPPVPCRTTSSEIVDIDFTLRRQFNKTSFRPPQREIIEAALNRYDVYVQAATSFGKSLCFQLPAVVDEGITIVVSPLLSLMMNQVETLQAAGINARSLNSNTPLQERNLILHDLATGHPRTKLLYVTPELCSTDRFRERLQIVHRQRELARIAIDEAHCISEWGHDFRRDFKRLSWFRQTFDDVPIMCLTATANPRISEDILHVLGIDTTPDRLQRFALSAHRPNLHLEVRYTSDEGDNRLSDFVKWIKGVHERRRGPERLKELDGSRVENVCGIIYTMSRNECESLSAKLREHGLGARPFHARLSNETKEDTLARWINNEEGYDIIVATTAFGMGIDKDNVRFVVHWRLPKSFEGYYQEVGRAGRDGKASYCFLYYSREDFERVHRMVRSESGLGGGGGSGGPNMEARLRSLQAISLFCEETNQCRHAQICRYFGEEEVPECDYACDWHKDANDLRKRFR